MQDRVMNVDLSGTQDKTTLLAPGVTDMGGGNILDRYVSIHLKGINLEVSGAGVISFFIGDQEIYRNEMTGAGTINENNINRYSQVQPRNGTFSISVSTAIDVQGTVNYQQEWAGGTEASTAPNQTVGSNVTS